jgi:hypothetical protein
MKGPSVYYLRIILYLLTPIHFVLPPTTVLRIGRNLSAINPSVTRGFKFQLLVRKKGGFKFIVPLNEFTNLRDNKDGVRYIIIIKGLSSAFGRNLVINTPSPCFTPYLCS